jgi:hypothetical protein
VLHSGSSFRRPALVDGALLILIFEPTRGELDVTLESKGRGDEGVKSLAELISKGHRSVYGELRPTRENNVDLREELDRRVKLLWRSHPARHQAAAVLVRAFGNSDAVLAALYGTSADRLWHRHFSIGDPVSGDVTAVVGVAVFEM